MPNSLAVSESRLHDVLSRMELPDRLSGHELVAVSGVLQNSIAQPRFLAVRDTLRASADAGVAHIVMLDNESDRRAAEAFMEVEAIVIEIDHESEGGLAKPYVMAAQLIEAAAPKASMVKFEGEKPLFAVARNVDAILSASQHYDVVTGERSEETWVSMPPYQVLTEYPLGDVIGQLLNVSRDTPSGVIVLNSTGRELLINWTNVNSWPYLYTIPYLATNALRYDVGTVEVDFRYHDSVVNEETGSNVFDRKRVLQIDAMIDGALAVATDAEKHKSAVQVERLRKFKRILEKQIPVAG